MNSLQWILFSSWQGTNSFFVQSPLSSIHFCCLSGKFTFTIFRLYASRWGILLQQFYYQTADLSFRSHRLLQIPDHIANLSLALFLTACTYYDDCSGPCFMPFVSIHVLLPSCHWSFSHPVFTVFFVPRCWRNVYRVLAFPLRWYCFSNAHVCPAVHIKHLYLRMPLHWLFRFQSRMLCLAFHTIYISPTIFFHPTSLPILLLDYMISLFVFLLRFDEGRQCLFVKI